jgi:acetyltransferase-like isoleucine patch superfamily enzyme
VNNFARAIRDMDTLAMDNPIKPLFGATVDQNTHLVNRIPAGMFDKCRDVTVGVGVMIEDGVRFACDKVTIGDFVYIGRGTTIRTPDFSIGDYTRLNEASYCGGRKPLHIGRNVYLGRGVYLDSNGGLTLEDNTLAGAYSQLWTHIEGGDMVYGVNPRWQAERQLVIEKDAWLVGRVVVSHAERIGERALVLNESNVLNDIPHDTTWAGNPAKDVTDKLGRQVENKHFWQIKQSLEMEMKAFEEKYPEHVDRLMVAHTIHNPEEPNPPMQIANYEWQFHNRLRLREFHRHNPPTIFYVQDRTYTKRRTAAEVAFMRFTSGKFTPVGEA